MKLLKVRVLIVGVFALLLGCAGTNDNALPAAKAASSTQTNSVVQVPRSVPNEKDIHYKIGVGDNVNIHVWRNADLSTTVPVRPDGYISMPLLGDIKASGLRPEELGAIIEKKLSGFLKDPRVSVIMQGLSSNEYINRVRVTGAVNHPTSVPYREGMTVLDLVLDTGGVNQFAAGNKTKIYRKVGTKTEVLEVKLKDILEKADLTTNFAILPGDVITVPERLF
jgi:polysaccharide export outer membrane protein